MEETVSSNLKSISYLLVLGMVAIVVGCAPTASQLKDVLEKNPDILTNAIEKNPGPIMDALQKAAQEAQKGARDREQEEMAKAREEEFKNPKKPVVEEDRIFRGKADAPILLVEYSDFQCPFCARGYSTVEEVRKKYGDKIKFVFKHLPLNFHPLAEPAAKRFEALALQSPEKAWKFHDEVFENQAKLNDGGEKWLDQIAKKVGGDISKMKKDMESDKVKARIKADVEEANSFGIQGTPGFIVGGVTLKGAYPLPEFEKIIERLIKDKGLN